MLKTKKTLHPCIPSYTSAYYGETVIKYVYTTTLQDTVIIFPLKFSIIARLFYAV